MRRQRPAGARSRHRHRFATCPRRRLRQLAACPARSRRCRACACVPARPSEPWQRSSRRLLRVWMPWRGCRCADSSRRHRLRRVPCCAPDRPTCRRSAASSPLLRWRRLPPWSPTPRRRFRLAAVSCRRRRRGVWCSRPPPGLPVPTPWRRCRRPRPELRSEAAPPPPRNPPPRLPPAPRPRRRPGRPRRRRRRRRPQGGPRPASLRSLWCRSS
mmetsp:Transcript_119912/g.382829  ORF Transcript_119912/g.382829 Transcript_119912/m.382829 type:complete len:214 (+) Transcript_119912:430-1071(+)